MRFLLDANLSPTLTAELNAAGFDTCHVADIGLVSASDEAIVDHTARAGFVIVTADSDFPMMLALRRAVSPSVVLLRSINDVPRAEQGALLRVNLPSVLDDLVRGAIVSLSPTRLAVRSLPIG